MHVRINQCFESEQGLSNQCPNKQSQVHPAACRGLAWPVLCLLRRIRADQLSQSRSWRDRAPRPLRTKDELENIAHFHKAEVNCALNFPFSRAKSKGMRAEITVGSSWTASTADGGASAGPHSPTVTVNPIFEVALGPSAARLTTSGSPSPFLVASGAALDENAISTASLGGLDMPMGSARSQRLFLSARAPFPGAGPAKSTRAWSSTPILDRHPGGHGRPSSASAAPGDSAGDSSAEQAASLRSAVRLLESFSSRQQVRF